jgi:carboxyl-terminal processing protease
VKDANSRIDGNFVGIGIRFQILKDTLMVVATIPGGPSEK